MAKPIPIEKVEYRNFKRLKGDCFQFTIGGHEVEAELIELTHHGDAPPGIEREPFSLVFRLDKGVARESGVHRVEHDKFEPMELLATPLAPDADGSYFEIVFN